MRNVEFWARELGLLPVPLKDTEQENGYVLLNGNRGNFYLKTTGEDLDQCSKAWSSDVGHVVNLNKDYLELQRWDRPEIYEKYKYKSVSENLAKFHSYLESNEPPRKYSVIGHVAGVFDNLRRKIDDAYDGGKALKAFLILLACAEEEVLPDNLQLYKWGIDETSLTIAKSINNSDWIALTEQLRNPPGFAPIMPTFARITPIINLVLRHASGLLFQEAHYRALMPPQILLPGFLSTESMRKIDSGKKTGVFFTPPAIARTLVEESLEAYGQLPHTITIFDPSCGSGEFLRESLRILKTKKIPITVNLIGWDVSSIAVDMARFVIAREKLFWLENRVTYRIEQRDSVTESWPSGVDIILMNPPFISWEEMSDDQRRKVAELPGLTKNKPNLAALFALKAADAVKEGGILGAVFPQSFTVTESAKKVRERIANEFSPKLIAKLGNQAIFHNATVDTSLYVGRKGRNTQGSAKLVWVDFRPESLFASMRALRKTRIMSIHGSPSIIFNDNYSIYYDNKIGKSGESWTPKPYGSWILLNKLASFSKVADIFNVHQGVRLGHDVFLLSASGYNNLPKGEKRFFRKAVVNDSIKSGCLFSTTYVWYPNTKGLPDLKSEKDLKRNVPNYYKSYLLPHKNALINRARVRESNWWKLSEHRAWLEEPSPKIVTTYFGDFGSFAWDSKGDHVPVVGNGWMPKKKITQPEMNDQVGHAYVAILSSSIVKTLLAAVSVHVGGGQLNLSNQYIKEMPLPNLLTGAFPRQLLLDLAVYGEKIARGESVGGDGLNELCKIAYFLK